MALTTTCGSRRGPSSKRTGTKPHGVHHDWTVDVVYDGGGGDDSIFQPGIVKGPLFPRRRRRQNSCYDWVRLWSFWWWFLQLLMFSSPLPMVTSFAPPPPNLLIGGACRLDRGHNNNRALSLLLLWQPPFAPTSSPSRTRSMGRRPSSSRSFLWLRSQSKHHVEHDEDNNNNKRRRSSFVHPSNQQQQHKGSFLQSWHRTAQTVFCTTLLILVVSWWPGAVVVHHGVAKAVEPPVTTTTTTTTTTSSGSIPAGQRYWSIMNAPLDTDDTNDNVREAKIVANQALMDYAVGTITTMYYDHTGGAVFEPRDFWMSWKQWLVQGASDDDDKTARTSGRDQLATRQGVVQGLVWLTRQLQDPFSTYLTREELLQELSVNNNNNNHQNNNGNRLQSLGAIVQVPREQDQETNLFWGALRTPVLVDLPPSLLASSSSSTNSPKASSSLLSARQVSSLPIVTAVVPQSLAERTGVTVGDRIVALEHDSFLGLSRSQVETTWNRPQQVVHVSSHEQPPQEEEEEEEEQPQQVEFTLAKPVYATTTMPVTATHVSSSESEIAAPSSSPALRSVIVAYRPQRIRLTLPSTSSTPGGLTQQQVPTNNLVPYQMLTVASESPFGTMLESPAEPNTRDTIHQYNKHKTAMDDYKVGYIRLTRFSKASTAGFVQAVHDLEGGTGRRGGGPHSDAASAYILDLRNNYGGVIQEALLTASSLLRDPHTVLCYTLNSRGGFTPHAVEEYVVDHRYPGYLLSRESPDATYWQLRKDSPQFFPSSTKGGGSGWTPPSSFASLHEQHVQRGFHTTPSTSTTTTTWSLWSSSITTMDRWVPPNRRQEAHQRAVQKPIVLLVNEGTASAAEVFASALHDNGRTVAIVGTRTYGKGYVRLNESLEFDLALRLSDRNVLISRVFVCIVRLFACLLWILLVLHISPHHYLD